MADIPNNGSGFMPSMLQQHDQSCNALLGQACLENLDHIFHNESVVFEAAGLPCLFTLSQRIIQFLLALPT
jgi:hypothetical protein